ncbi:galectin [Serendipita vermifera]|nr:galectin [Serendipita vermifera]
MFYIIPLTKTVTLKSELKADGIVIFQSAKLDLHPSPTGTNTIDNTALNLINGNDILLTISIRRVENAVVFNSMLNNGWGNEERIPLQGAFKGNDTTVMVYDHGDRYQILFNYHTVKYYNKRSQKNATSLSYAINADQVSPFSDSIAANTYTSMAKLLPTDD